MSIRIRGEELWWANRHIANLRLASNSELPFVVQSVNGEVVFAARDRRTAELWAAVHARELLLPAVTSESPARSDRA